MLYNKKFYIGEYNFDQMYTVFPKIKELQHFHNVIPWDWVNHLFKIKKKYHLWFILDLSLWNDIIPKSGIFANKAHRKKSFLIFMNKRIQTCLKPICNDSWEYLVSCVKQWYRPPISQIFTLLISLW